MNKSRRPFPIARELSHNNYIEFWDPDNKEWYTTTKPGDESVRNTAAHTLASLSSDETNGQSPETSESEVSWE